MPELPEVETVVRTLRPVIVGAIIDTVRHVRADMLTPPGIDLGAHLAGRRFTSVQRRGKRILLSLDDRCTLTIHLGMTGQLTIAAPDAPLKPHTHLILALSTPASPAPLELRFRDPRRFGAIALLCPTDMPDANLGPEPLQIRPRQLAGRLMRTRRPIKAALLDQALIAGLGNIYVDESLFHARIHPQALSHRLRPEQVRRLNRAIKTILRRAIRNRGSSIRDYVDSNGSAGSAQSLHRVYDREGEPCRTCRTPIQRIILGGRSTHFCPKCQKRTGR